jgi:hypothetical protein
MNRTNLAAALTTSLFLALLVAPVAAAPPGICIYPAVGAGAPAAPATGSSPGPWGAVYTTPDPACPANASFTHTSPSCLAPGPHPGEFCGPVVFTPTSPTTGFLWTCTAYPNPMVSLTGLIVAWDVTGPGPGGFPDGIVDALDAAVTGPNEGAMQSVPGPGGAYTSFVYPPMMPTGSAQLVAFPIATSLLPPPLGSTPIAVGCA